MAEYGEILGSAVKVDYDQQVNDLFKYDEMRKRTQAINQAKAELFAADTDFQNAMNEYDNPRAKKFVNDQLLKIGRYYRENPDVLTNPIKMATIKQMKREIKDNPILLRGYAVDKAYADYLKDRQEAVKNPNQWDMEALDAEGQKFNNYFKTGNARGLEGLKVEGEQPVVYTRPKEFINLPETLLKSGQMINPSLVVKGKNLGEHTRTANPEHVAAIKNGIWKENGRQIEVEARKLGLKTPEQIDKWLTDGIMAGVKTTYDPGDPNAAFENQMRVREFNQRQGKIDSKQNVSRGIEPWDDLNNPNKPAGFAPQDVTLKVFGDTPNIKLVGNTGQEVDLTGNKVSYDNRYFTDGKGVRRLIATTDLTESMATDLGIYSPSSTSIEEANLTPEGKAIFNATGGLEGAKNGISAEYLGKAVIRGVDKDGKKIIRVTTSVPIDKNNGSMRQLWNTHSQPAKLATNLEESEVGGGSQQPKQQSATYDGRQVGSIVKTNKGNYLVTANGYVPQ